MFEVFLPLVLERRTLLLEARHVRTILGSVAVTPVPHANLRLPGVFAHAHRALPLLDLAAVLDLSADGSVARPRTVIVTLEHETLGLAADRVLEVIRLPRDEVRPPHAFPGPYAKAEVTLDGAAATVLDLERLVADCIPEVV